MDRIVLSSHNKGKLIELKELLQLKNVELSLASDFNIEDIPETGTTFIENAIIKAETACRLTGLPALGDDSGLSIDVLDGFPGIYSARCAGEGASDKERRDFVLEKMLSYEDRRAEFICALAFSRPNKPTSWMMGHCKGILLNVPRGNAKPGLPYDSILYIPELNKSIAELTNEKKNTISHRGNACRSMKKFLEILYQDKKRY